MPGALAGLAARLYTRLGLANAVRPFLNTVITNVPGPQVPLYFTGARMVGELWHGAGDGRHGSHPSGLQLLRAASAISFTSCRDMMPDPEFYAECLQDSFDELLDAANRQAP